MKQVADRILSHVFQQKKAHRPQSSAVVDLDHKSAWFLAQRIREAKMTAVVLAPRCRCKRCVEADKGCRGRQPRSRAHLHGNRSHAKGGEADVAKRENYLH